MLWPYFCTDEGYICFGFDSGGGVQPSWYQRQNEPIRSMSAKLPALREILAAVKADECPPSVVIDWLREHEDRSQWKYIGAYGYDPPQPVPDDVWNEFLEVIEAAARAVIEEALR